MTHSFLTQLTQRPFINSEPELFRTSRFNPLFINSVIYRDLQFKKLLWKSNKFSWFVFCILRIVYIYFYYYIIQTIQGIFRRSRHKKIDQLYNKYGIQIYFYFPAAKDFVYIVPTVNPFPNRKYKFVKVFKSRLDKTEISAHLKSFTEELLEINNKQSWGDYDDNTYEKELKLLEVTSNRNLVKTYNLIMLYLRSMKGEYGFSRMKKYKQSAYSGMELSEDDEKKNIVGTIKEGIDYDYAAERLIELINSY